MTLPRPCQEFRAMIPDRLSGDLSLAQNELFEAHQQRCPECRSEVEKYQKLLGAMRSHFGGLKPVTPRPRLPVETPASAESSIPTWLAPWLTPFRLVGATIVVAVLLPLFVRLVLLPIGYSPIPARDVREGAAMVALTAGTLRETSGGATVSSGLLVQTGTSYLAQEDAQIVFAFGPAVTLQPASRFSVSSNAVHLEAGVIHCLVRGAAATGFRVVTPTAVLAVRGTEFNVVAGPDGTLVRLLAGRLQVDTVSGAARADLAPGQSVLVLRNEPPVVLPTVRLGSSELDAPTVPVDASFWRKQGERWRKAAEPSLRPAMASPPIVLPAPAPIVKPRPEPVEPRPQQGSIPPALPDLTTIEPPAVTSDPQPVATPAIHVDGFPKAP